MRRRRMRHSGADSRLVEPLVLDGDRDHRAHEGDQPRVHGRRSAATYPPAGRRDALCCARGTRGPKDASSPSISTSPSVATTPRLTASSTPLPRCSRAMRSFPGRPARRSSMSSGRSSLKQAVGVSADLREGVRRSVEDVANEIVTQRLAKNLRVYNEPDVARRLTRESLRFLYRILFLLYAEARPELGIVPSLGEGYRDGYGLDRLRELALTELTTEHANNGTHLHDSLDILFELVNDGYHHEFAQQQFTEPGDAIDDTGLIFEPLHSELFGPNATPLLDSIRLRNEVVQRVLARLLLTQEKGGRETGASCPTPTLGINQLGAVYEGLMAYTGLLGRRGPARGPQARRRRRSTARGSCPVAKADEYDDEVFVTEIGDDGISRRVTHKKGSFVYRLSGRDRQRSASYYTPEVLTRCVVKHALEELLDQDGRDDQRGRAARPHDLRAGAGVRSLPQRGDQPALGRVSAPQAGRARRHDRSGPVRGRAPEGQDAFRPAPELRRGPQRHRCRARRGLALAQRHAPRPARTVVRPAPAPRELADRRSPRACTRRAQLSGQELAQGGPARSRAGDRRARPPESPPLPAARRGWGSGRGRARRPRSCAPTRSRR